MKFPPIGSCETKCPFFLVGFPNWAAEGDGMKFPPIRRPVTTKIFTGMTKKIHNIFKFISHKEKEMHNCKGLDYELLFIFAFKIHPSYYVKCCWEFTEKTV